MKFIYQFSGVDCATCASSLEADLQEQQEINNVIVDFIQQKIIIESNADEETIWSILNHRAKLVEPDIKIKRSDDKKIEKSFLLLDLKTRIVLSTLLFMYALLTKNQVISDIAYILSYFIVGYSVLMTAYRNIIRGKVFDENFLMSVATIGALSINEYPEAVAVMLLYQIGELLQDYAVEKSRRSIADLMNIKSDFVTLKKANDTIQVKPEVVNAGDLIIVAPGEKIPLDGIIIDGTSNLDMRSLTGEPFFKEAMIGNEVLSGSININGVLTIKVTKLYKNSTVMRILELVENASSKKTKTEKLITKFAAVYTPVVVGIALLIAVIPLFLVGSLNHEYIYRALVFLMISCPCALVISIPLSYFAGVGAASRNGIIVKGSNYLENMTNIGVVVFDKTGTLTKGEYSISKLIPHHVTEAMLLEYAAYGEYYASHPLKKTILDSYKKEIRNDLIGDAKELVNRGMSVQYKNKRLLVGNEKLMIDNNLDFESFDTDATVIYVAYDNVYVGAILISDQIREQSRDLILKLAKLKINDIVMLTGDNQKTGQRVAEQLGIKRVYSGLLPEDKVNVLEKLITETAKDKKVIFVGDGINDAPVLTLADVGIAMGAMGSDAAIEAADIVLMNDNLLKIITVINIANKTKKTAKQNIIFVLGIKFLVLALGAFGLASMWEAVFADVIVSLIAILNGIKLLLINKTSDI